MGLFGCGLDGSIIHKTMTKLYISRLLIIVGTVRNCENCQIEIVFDFTLCCELCVHEYSDSQPKNERGVSRNRYEIYRVWPRCVPVYLNLPSPMAIIFHVFLQSLASSPLLQIKIWWA